MATSLSTYLKLRIDSKLTDDAKHNLLKLDNLGSLYQIDSSSVARIRSRTNIIFQPEDRSIGGSGVGGEILLGTADQPISNINLHATDISFHGNITSDQINTEAVALSNNNFTLSLLAGNLSDNLSLTLPNSIGTVNQVLSSDGLGNLVWTTVSGLSVGQETTVTWLNADGLTKTINHGFNSRNIMVQIIDPSDNYRNVEVDNIERPTNSTIILEASVAPSSSWLVLLKQIGS